jgi:hypothetical protein
MTKRVKLPNRRYHETFSLQHWNMTYKIGLGRSDDGVVQEVFINCGRSGEQAETLARDSAILLSLALQYGVPKEAMKKSITRNLDNTPTGPIGAIIDIL